MRSIAASGNANVILRRQEVQALLHMRDDPSKLSADERNRLLLAFSQLDQALIEMRSDLVVFSFGNEMALEGRPLTPSAEMPIFEQLPQ
jgi:hypothetical protein